MKRKERVNVPGRRKNGTLIYKRIISLVVLERILNYITHNERGSAASSFLRVCLLRVLWWNSFVSSVIRSSRLANYQRRKNNDVILLLWQQRATKLFLGSCWSSLINRMPILMKFHVQCFVLFRFVVQSRDTVGRTSDRLINNETLNTHVFKN